MDCPFNRTVEASVVWKHHVFFSLSSLPGHGGVGRITSLEDLLGSTAGGGTDALCFLNLNHTAVVDGELDGSVAHIAQGTQDFVVRKAFMFLRCGRFGELADRLHV
jgi:hypothetical protein